jgi:hypothetical protein
MTRLIRTDLIIVDDIGLLPVAPDAAEGFFRLVDAAYERHSLAVSSNLHPSRIFVRRIRATARPTTGRRGGRCVGCGGGPCAAVPVVMGDVGGRSWSNCARADGGSALSPPNTSLTS